MNTLKTNPIGQIFLSFIYPLQNLLNSFVPSEREDNFISVIYWVIKKFKIKITITSIIEYFKSHPNYPSLKSICDFFNELNVLNYAIRIEESELNNLREPFIAYIEEKETGGKVMLVYSIEKKNVVYADSLRGKKYMNIWQFLEKWNGVVIVIEPTESSGEADYNEKEKMK